VRIARAGCGPASSRSAIASGRLACHPPVDDLSPLSRSSALPTSSVMLRSPGPASGSRDEPGKSASRSRRKVGEAVRVRPGFSSEQHRGKGKGPRRGRFSPPPPDSARSPRATRQGCRARQSRTHESRFADPNASINAYVHTPRPRPARRLIVVEYRAVLAAVFCPSVCWRTRRYMAGCRRSCWRAGHRARSMSASTVASPHSSRWVPRRQRSPGICDRILGRLGNPSSASSGPALAVRERQQPL
jgi:hypothetical protein